MGKPQLTGEIRFPQYDLYPMNNEFQELYLSGYFQLSAINYKLDQYGDGLSGVQLVFSNGLSSPFLEVQEAKNSDF